MNNLRIFKHFNSIIMIIIFSICHRTLAQDTSSFPYINYLGAVSGRKLFYKIQLHDVAKPRFDFMIQCQNIESKDNYIEAMFVRTDSDEPIYFKIYNNEVFDSSIGGIILKANITKGDCWENFGKKSHKLMSKVSVISVDSKLSFKKIGLKKCIILIINDYAENNVKKLIYAEGIGLVREIVYSDPLRTKILKSINLEKIFKE